MNKSFVISFLAALALSHISFAQDPDTPPKSLAPPVQPATSHASDTDSALPAHGALVRGDKASAIMESKSGSKVTGEVHFSQMATGIQVQYKLRGLAKNDVYGFHIHEKGDCSSADGKSAGKHYLMLAPKGGTSLDNPQKYAGDLPSVKADANGEASGSFNVSGLTINKKNSITNRAIILHGGPDDITKKSAARIACGVIK